MTMQQPVGVFDSGVGGLSVLASIRHALPAESLIYVADSKYMPYGCKPESEILARCMQIADYFAARECKAMVVACNTATAASVAHIRDRYDYPVIGMEPAVKPAVQLSRSGVVGVLATRATCASGKFNRLIDRFTHASILVQPAPGLVERIEMGDLDGEETKALLRRYLQPLLMQKVDTLVLGCTHYPFLQSQIRAIVGEAVEIIDSGDAIARELARQLQRRDHLQCSDQHGEIEFLSSTPVTQYASLISRLWGAPIRLQALPF